MSSQATMSRETRDRESTVPVLVVGGGLAGLSTALFLSWHGIRPLLVERHPDLLIHPRARGFTPRTIELFRQVGLEPAIKAASYAEGESFRWTAVRADSLAAEHIPVEEPAEDADMGQLSPAPFGWIDQDKLEIILRDRARELGADIRFAAELVSFAQDDNGVMATIEDRVTGATTNVRASYLVAADGWDSGTREQLAIPLDGPGPFFNVITALVTADLHRALQGRPVSIAYLQQPRPGTMLMAHDDAGQRWVFGTGFSPQHGESAADFDEARIVAMVREAAGLPDVDVALRPQIPGTDMNVLGFTIGAQLARAYRAGRVLLVGDAAHIVPPTGGFGANTGIQDAHNLAWKLALMLRGAATDRLLDSYQSERHAAGLLTMQQALARWGDRVGAGREGEDQFLDYRSVAFGYIYRSDAVVCAPGGDEAALDVAALHAQPGTRAPHVWLTGQEGPVSTIDLFGRGFVLLTDTTGTQWRDAAKSLNEPRVAVFRIGAEGELGDPEGEWGRTYAVDPGGAVLVRPDGFVAWRAPGMSANPEGELAAAMAQITGHAVRSAANC